MAVFHFLLLSCLGLVVRVRAQNCSKPVPGDNMNLRDKYILSEMFRDGAKVYFRCNVGYQPAGGSPAIVCTAGSWSSLMYKCERKNCGSAGELLNGDVEYPDSTLFGDKAVFICHEGYTLVGRTETLCIDQGWRDRLPVCEVAACDPPPKIENGSYSPINEIYAYRDAILYKCKNHYTLIGSKSRTCSSDGTFKPDSPTCKWIRCEDPSVDNAIWRRHPPYEFDSTIQLQCINGYVMKGEGTLKCDINSRWSPGLPTCEPKNCSRPVTQPSMSLNTSTQTFIHGTRVSFACNVGYMPTGGSGITTCTTGNWSPSTLICQKKNCGRPGELANGTVEYPEGTEFGDKATYTCHTGFQLVGNPVRICEDQGWSTELPVCEVVTCDPPPGILNGTFSPNNEIYKYRDVVQYSCETNHILVGQKSQTCSEDGTFEPDPPTCVIPCKDPAVDNATWSSLPPYIPASTVTLSCRSGYIIKGEPTQTCDINSRWSPGLPTCEPKNCSRPVTQPSMSLNTSIQTFIHGTRISFACIVGYMPTGGSGVTTCTTGNWSPTTLICQKKNCGRPGELANATVKYPEGTKFGDKATYTCHTGYKLVGNPVRFCEDQGWSTELPVCEEVTCDPPHKIVNGTFSPNNEIYRYRDVIQYSCETNHKLVGQKSQTCSEDGTFKPDPPTCKRSQQTLVIVLCSVGGLFIGVIPIGVIYYGISYMKKRSLIKSLEKNELKQDTELQPLPLEQ